MVIVNHTHHRYYWSEDSLMCHSCNRTRCVVSPILTDLPEDMLHTLCSSMPAFICQWHYMDIISQVCVAIFTPELMETLHACRVL